MMIEVKNMSFSYGKRKQKVFDDFSLALDKGSVYGLLGKNGTGKSTLLYLMTGLLRPQAGRVLYKGVDVSMRYPLTLQDMFLVPEEFFAISQFETILETEYSVLSEFQQ